MEIWKKIKDFENYEVSNMGNIRNTNYHRQRKTKNIVQRDNGTGYMRVILSKNGKTYTLYVHRIVANEFCENKEKKNVVNHKDGNRKNNASENLEWCSTKENIDHMYKVLGYKQSKKTIDKKRKAMIGRVLSYETKIKISKSNKGKYSKRVLCVELGKEFESATKASQWLGYKVNTVPKACKNGKTSGGYHWKYL